MTGLKAGDRISEYIVEGLLGAGAFGQVWKAVHHIWKDRRVAIKVPTDPQFVRNLRQEGVALHGLEHPNIVKALGLDPFATPPYFIMEYVAGCSLRDWVAAHPKGMVVADIEAVMRGTLSGLQHAHRAGLTHRDIKPENVLLADADPKNPGRLQPLQIKVTDFGLGRACALTSQSMIQSGEFEPGPGRTISGTVAYMSPEQRDRDEADPVSDLYSVGVVLFEMACGERPGGTELPSQVREQLPHWVDHLFTRMYARRERRFESAGEALAALEAALSPPRLSGRAAPRGTPPPIVSGRGIACPSCGIVAESDDNFCTHCGQQLVDAPPRCGHCHGFLESNDRFCIFCGAPVDAAVR